MRLDPEYPTAMSHYGIACLEIDELEEAQAAFDMALKLDDQDHLAIFGLATLSLLDEDYEAALEQVNRALAISPDEAGYRNLLGIVYSELGRRGEALEAFRDAMRLDPVASAKILRNIATLHEVSWN